MASLYARLCTLGSPVSGTCIYPCSPRCNATRGSILQDDQKTQTQLVAFLSLGQSQNRFFRLVMLIPSDLIKRQLIIVELIVEWQLISFGVSFTRPQESFELVLQEPSLWSNEAVIKREKMFFLSLEQNCPSLKYLKALAVLWVEVQLFAKGIAK